MKDVHDEVIREDDQHKLKTSDHVEHELSTAHGGV